tara:strand:- start:2486 stop:3136 length:651 start_codon:yes stop_codon:yes gene_type:complete
MNYTNLLEYSPLFVIPASDFILCKLFSKNARWAQLHSFINIIIVYIIKDDVYGLITNPLSNIKIIKDPLELEYIIYLHIYHFIFFKNSFIDYFHHIVFVLLGCYPIYKYYNYNIIRLATFSGCGLPGVIEYFTLSLVKNNKLYSLTQKNIMSNIYNYFRYPFSIYACSNILIFNNINLVIVNKNILIYIVFLTYFNSSYFNKLIIENCLWHKLSIR